MNKDTASHSYGAPQTSSAELAFCGNYFRQAYEYKPFPISRAAKTALSIFANLLTILSFPSVGPATIEATGAQLEQEQRMQMLQSDRN